MLKDGAKMKIKEVVLFWIIAVAFFSFHLEGPAHSGVHQTTQPGTSGLLPVDELENKFSKTGIAYFNSNLLLRVEKNMNDTDRQTYLIQQL
jgi:hypothetical protein